jgi:carbon starvation protein
MRATYLAIFAIASFLLGYRFYARFLNRVVFKLDQQSGPTPAHEFNDNCDFVPARRSVLFGHHFSSIAGAAPIVGPAVAVIWGWLPAIVWVVFGTILLGAAHDFGALVVSMRNQGRSIGHICESVLGQRARSLFLLVIFFLVLMVIAVFALVIANLFVSFPSSVLPVNFQIVVALLIGWFVNRRGKKLLIPTLLAVFSLFVVLYYGSQFPISLEGIFGKHQLMIWMLFLLIYSYLASTLPVWLLLQPRDYINSFLLFTGLGALLLGLFVANPVVVAPMINPAPEGAPPWFPFLFITIACGAISGFHGLVSSGTTSKQVTKWQDAKSIGYGSMLGEGLLALIATLAATAGFSSSSQWHSHYSNWNAANGFSAKIDAFVHGASSFLSSLGIPIEVGQTIVAVLIITFAATSLDTAARIQRYVVGEIGLNWKIKPLANRSLAGLVAIGSAFILMLFKGGGAGGLLLWPLFGASNQMLAGLTLLVIMLYLRQKNLPHMSYLLPAVFMLALTTVGLTLNVKSFLVRQDWLLTSIAFVLLIIQTWIITEGIRAYNAKPR